MSDPTVEKEAGSTGPTKETPTPEPEKKKREYKDFGHDEEEKPSHARVDMSTIQLKAEDLYDKEKVDLETIVVDDVFKLLQCDEGGLDDAEAVRRLEIFGPNKLESEEQNPFLQFLSFMWNPLSWVMEAAALVAIVLSNGEHRPPDWEDFTEAQEEKLESDVEEFAQRGLRALAVAYEEVDGDDPEGEGNGFELIGLLAIFDPPREDTKQTIDDAQALGVRVKMVTGDQLAIAKETGRRLGLGDHMYPAKVLKDGPEPGGKHASLDAMILDADGFAGVFPEHKYEIVKRLQGLGHLCAMTGDGANDAPALSRANVGIAVEGATDAARGAADIVLTEPGLSTIVHAIRGSRVIFQRMRNYSIYACAVTIRIVVCFAILAFAFKFDFPPFMVLIIALLNDGTIMTLSVDRVLPSMTPDSWDLAEIFSFAVAYGLYLTLSTIALVAIIIRTTWFFDKFGVTLTNGAHQALNHNDPQLHMIVYLQVAIISQALIFITRSHGFFFMERPSAALFGAFCIAQLVSSIIAAYANWGFTNIHAISGGWIGIVWVWNIVWFFPLDLIKFAMKATIIKRLRARHLADMAQHTKETGVPITRTTSRVASIHESLYKNRVSFIRRAARKIGFGQKISMKPEELQRFSSIQAQRAGLSVGRRSQSAGDRGCRQDNLFFVESKPAYSGCYGGTIQFAPPMQRRFPVTVPSIGLRISPEHLLNSFALKLAVVASFSRRVIAPHVTRKLFAQIFLLD
ncbi:Plasma membrane ATPase 2 [Grifola frondosa]|uniref:Plasma membrane ATPase 2 n=1 Tax=Grifola frondosa TaxID=5627 RepID=A0A1C7LNE3_GRIFR|nr:Plasma membrane ATPase 2 [Grifola frondosa]